MASPTAQMSAALADATPYAPTPGAVSRTVAFHCTPFECSKSGYCRFTFDLGNAQLLLHDRSALRERYRGIGGNAGATRLPGCHPTWNRGRLAQRPSRAKSGGEVPPRTRSHPLSPMTPPLLVGQHWVSELPETAGTGRNNQAIDL